MVSLAGPATNVVLAALVGRWPSWPFDARRRTSAARQLPTVRAGSSSYLGLVNIWLAVFNLIPRAAAGRLGRPRAAAAASAWWPGYLPDPALTPCSSSWC